MKTYRVVFRPLAEEDLIGLYEYISEHSGLKIAGEYIGRIETTCMSLQHAPHRGTRRDDLGRGLRVLGFERRAVVVFRVKASEVSIVRIFYGGRDFERILKNISEE